MRDTCNERRTLLRYAAVAAVLPVVQACGTLPRGGNASTNTDGSDLAVSVFNALKQSPFTSQSQVNVSSIGDEVIIKGFARDTNEVESIENVAFNVAGVRHVVMEVFVR